MPGNKSKETHLLSPSFLNSLEIFEDGFGGECHRLPSFAHGRELLVNWASGGGSHRSYRGGRLTTSSLSSIISLEGLRVL